MSFSHTYRSFLTGCQTILNDSKAKRFLTAIFSIISWKTSITFMGFVFEIGIDFFMEKKNKERH
jgi:hypothetical protein